MAVSNKQIAKTNKKEGIDKTLTMRKSGSGEKSLQSRWW